ncbi:hypothetical protein [Leptospira borgpetersenii]|uniref:Uncharacterized protein n=2 Tax=Leptospira borgpetersenii TaxID=174 RepID=M3F740_LEPBO|nr:hypothetical protein [Leptospira borgpetersenii]EKP11566.1 hypothetical protein LEP1GSC128_0987 [Leptospira borgpetersenii str. 200801926]EMF97787.1 hypothetical protein LEP1GSC123_0935 [Leptospira borgpetersenii str. 200701203]ENO62809.1 hypothetical protein LEP1GSC191_4221 [Leptospira borgpetersenii serovar Mini str. 201000851]
METFTLDELQELRFFVRSKMDETRDRIVDIQMIIGFDETDRENSNQMLKYYERELKTFEVIESKLEKMRDSIEEKV